MPSWFCLRLGSGFFFGTWEPVSLVARRRLLLCRRSRGLLWLLGAGGSGCLLAVAPLQLLSPPVQRELPPFAPLLIDYSILKISCHSGFNHAIMMFFIFQFVSDMCFFLHFNIKLTPIADQLPFHSFGVVNINQ